MCEILVVVCSSLFGFLVFGCLHGCFVLFVRLLFFVCLFVLFVCLFVCFLFVFLSVGFFDNMLTLVCLLFVCMIGCWLLFVFWFVC